MEKSEIESKIKSAELNDDLKSFHKSLLSLNN